MRCVVLVPTYNNATTLQSVLDRLQPYTSDILVVNDGSTDNTLEILQHYAHPIHIVTYEKNRGKGHALVTGFREAMKLGYDYAITIDSDGQHYPEDLPLFVNKLKEQKSPTIIVGKRELEHKNKSKSAVYATRLANFWFTFQTWKHLPDTQSGYRLYPLHHLHGLNFVTSRYEAEFELLVFAAWHGVDIDTVPIRVYYPPKEERVSHFRPLWDFLRIFALNTVLLFASVFYGWWAMLWNRRNKE
jgi:glycosyltransferase involved in cell wall biosynthesis